jgi:thiol-disulfide isomerase/thioredoxin
MKYLLVLLCSFSCLTSNIVIADEVPIGSSLRDSPMQGLTGDSLLLSEYRGKPLLINVWASYCSPCLAEMGSLERLWQRYAEDFNIIGICIDGYPERAQAFLSKADSSFPHYIDHKLTLERMLGASSIPLTVLVDENGKVLQKVRGAREWDSPEIIKAIGLTYEIEM